ncbi:MAG: hypothetical protein JNM53_13730, partial [Gemmatimonadetes bacterium]|nr:hypothetical protein [Gemmatimonadota bacterium]
MPALSRFTSSIACGVPAIALALLAACSDSGGSSNGGPGADTVSSFLGIISSDDAAESGAISITISTPNPAPPVPTSFSYAVVPAEGSVTVLGGSSVDLTGTYDDGTKAVTLTGGGYSFAGVFDGSNRLEGTYTG